MYWTDAREQHGTGRRSIQPVDHLQGGGLAGTWPGHQDVKKNPERDPTILGGKKGYGVFHPTDADFVHGSDQNAQNQEISAASGAASEYSVGRDPSKFCQSPQDQGPDFAPTAGNLPERLQLFTVEDDGQCENKEMAPPDMFGRRTPTNNSLNGPDAGFQQRRSAATSGGRKMVESDAKATHMQNMGTSAPVVEPHGRGRAYINHQDHQPTRLEHEERLPPGQGRKAFVISDSVGSQVLQPLEEADPTAGPPSNDDMKDSVKEWLEEAHGMLVVSEKWGSVVLKQHGSNWSIQAITDRGSSVTRDAPTAKAIAEKLSMMPVLELRHFGVRFGTAAELQGSAERRRKAHGGPSEDLTYASVGVRSAINGISTEGPDISTKKRDPEDYQRRYIQSGRDHFHGTVVADGDPPGSHGHARDYGVVDGLPRGIGHGKRHIGEKSQLFGGSLK